MRAAIIGGTGRMGRWFARYFRDKGFEVIISGRNPHKSAEAAKRLGVNYARSNVEAVANADIVIVSTPILVTAKTILEISGHMKEGAIIFDIASIKRDVVRALEKVAEKGVRALSVHPLYGPGAKCVKGRRFLVIPINNDLGVVESVSKMFESDGGIVHMVESGEAHDRMMALTLGLPHFINIVFGKILAREDVVEVKKFGGTTFTLQLLLLESVLSQDPGLCYEILTLNPAFTQVLEDLSKIFKKEASLIWRGDERDFKEEFEATRNSISRDPDYSEAYEKFYKMLEAVG